MPDHDVMDDILAADRQAAPVSEEPVVGAPPPGSKQDYSAVPDGSHDVMDDILAADKPTLPAGGDREAVMARIEAANANRPAIDTHPLFGQEPGALRAGMDVPRAPASGVMAAGPGSLAGGEENDAFWRHLITNVPIAGEGLKNVGEGIAASRRQSLTGLPRSGAEAELEAERGATDRAHPRWATAGDVVGSVGPLAALGAELPAWFGLASKAGYKLPALIGGASNTIIKALDNLIRGKPQDPVELGLTAVAGAGASALATSLNRVLVTALKPGLEGLYRTAVKTYKIPLGAGKISANPVYGKLDGQLLAEGETLFPAVAAAQRGVARGISAWHKAITATIGSNADRLTARVLADNSARIAGRIKELSKLPVGTRWATDEMAQLAEQAKNIRILESVTKIDKFGRFTPEQFHDAIKGVLDASGQYAKGGGGPLGDLADIAGVFLKSAPNPKIDLSTAVRILKGSLKQGLFTGAPAAAFHLLTEGLAMPEGLTTAGIITAPVAAAKLGARLIGTHVAGALARSERLGNALVSRSMPMMVRPTAGLAKATAPGLIQQAVPLGDKYLRQVTTP